MNHPLILAAGAMAGYAARCELARRHRPLIRRRDLAWLHSALGKALTAADPSGRPESLTVAVRSPDGSVTAWTMLPHASRPFAMYRVPPSRGGAP